MARCGVVAPAKTSARRHILAEMQKRFAFAAFFAVKWNGANSARRS
jgi:hypothetical protein